MYPVSSDFLAKVNSIDREWDLRMTITPIGKKPLTLGSRDLALGKFKFQEGATCGEAVQTGSTYCNSLKFTLMNYDKKFDNVDFYGATVTAEVGLNLGAPKGYEYVPLGEFFIIDPVKKFTTIPITAFDAMCNVNKVLDFSSIVFPTNCSTLFTAICEQCNVQATPELTDEVASITVPIESLLTNNPTCRDILAGIGVYLKKNIRFSRTGKLESFWYAPVSLSTTKDTRVGESKYTDRPIVPTGVYLKDAYGNDFKVGEVTYPVKLPDSPIIQGEENSIKVLTETLALLQQMPYIPATVYPMGNPAVQAGDIVNHLDTQNGIIAQPIMISTYSITGKTTWESKGISAVEERQESPMSRDVQKIFAKTDLDRRVLESKIQQSADEILLQVSKKADEDALASLKVSVDGISTVVQEHSDELGNVQSSIDQNATQIQTNFQQTITDITQLQSETNSQFNTISTYIRFDADGIHIGKTKGETELHQSNTELVFQMAQTGEELASFGVDRGRVPNLEVDKSAKFGNYYVDMTNGIAFKNLGGF